jgi:hypothetical protein
VVLGKLGDHGFRVVYSINGIFSVQKKITYYFWTKVTKNSILRPISGFQAHTFSLAARMLTSLGSLVSVVAISYTN